MSKTKDIAGQTLMYYFFMPLLGFSIEEIKEQKDNIRFYFIIEQKQDIYNDIPQVINKLCFAIRFNTLVVYPKKESSYVSRYEDVKNSTEDKTVTFIIKHEHREDMYKFMTKNFKGISKTLIDFILDTYSKSSIIKTIKPILTPTKEMIEHLALMYQVDEKLITSTVSFDLITEDTTLWLPIT
jgi:hypothetical protein